MKYLDRDISWLSFNQRVSDETLKSIPLQSKIMFHGITHSNLREFLMVRYPSMFEYSTSDMIEDFKKHVISHHETLVNRYRKFESSHRSDIFVTWKKLTKRERNTIKRSFMKTVFPSIQVVGYNPADHIYLHSGMYIHIDYVIDKTRKYAYIEIPSTVPRFIRTGVGNRMIYVEDAIRKYIDKLIIGIEHPRIIEFVISHSAEVYMQNVKYVDPYQMISDTLKQREKSWITYMEVAAEKDNRDIITQLIDVIASTNKDTLVLHTPRVALYDLKEFPKDGFRDSEKSKVHEPVETFPTTSSIFDYIEKADRVAYHPYESYQNTMVRFLEEAAEDPDTISIKISLYRVSNHSRIIDALLKAADNGKHVVVLIELKARFDERHNMEIANILREGGVRIVYTKPDIKTHAKVCLVTKRVNGKTRIYSQVGTGNYSESNAKLYSDYSYFSARQDLGRDLNKFFNLITSEQGTFKSNRIIYAPYNMRDELLHQIERQVKRAEKGRRARIIAKCNSLTDDKMADKLVAAAEAGVKVILIVRGACILEPRKNIKIYSIVGTFLEHSRIYAFGYGKRSVVYLGSADLMYRSFNRRFELLMRVENHDLKRRISNHLKMYLKDTVNCRRILKNYKYVDVKRKKKYNCHEEFYKEAKRLAAQ